MKNSKFTKNIALITCTLAMFIATTSSSMCISWWFHEPKMPKSLQK